MSGILDNKSRILDTIVTLEGRRQLSAGGINIKYVTFSDNATFYQADEVNAATDATRRLYFESCHQPQDQITFLSDPNGKLTEYARDAVQVIRHGQILQAGETISPTGEIYTSYTPLAGDDFLNAVDTLVQSSVENFDKLKAISTRDFLFEDDGFGIDSNEIKFTIGQNVPLSQEEKRVKFSHLNEIYNDPRLSNLANFKYLPPINKIEDRSIDKSDLPSSVPKLGNYLPWGQTNGPNILSVLKEHAVFAASGNAKSIRFDPTSRENNIFMQFFELSKDNIKKLDVIDFGRWQLTQAQLDELSIYMPERYMPGHLVHVLFIGKVLESPDDNTSSFIHLFTLLFG